MSQRFRITVRGLAIELRGYIDQGIDEDQPTLQQLAEAMTPFGIVAASPAPVDYDPFAISEPDNPPTPEKSREVIESIFAGKFSIDEVITELAMVHFMQAQVIRGERATREQAERELARRELHHFETEQFLERIKANRSNHPDLPVCEKHPDEQDAIKCGWRSCVEDIDKVLAEVPE